MNGRSLEQNTKAHTESLQSTTESAVCEQRGRSRLAAVHHSAMTRTKTVNTPEPVLCRFFPPFFGLWRLRWTTPIHSAPKRGKGCPLPPAFICSALARGRKFTAKSERDVICGKTLLFFHEVITSPWVEWLAATKGPLFGWHNAPLYSTAWPHMQMTGQEGKVWRCQVRAQRENTHRAPAGWKSVLGGEGGLLCC